MVHCNRSEPQRLEGLTKLETLYLCVPVSKASLPSLKKMSALSSLYIGSVEPDPIEWLKAELPGVGVY